MKHIGVVQDVDPRKCIRTSYQRLPTKQTVQSLVKSFSEYGYQPETDGSQRISARRPRLGELRDALVRGDGLSEAAAMQLAQEKNKDAEKDGYYVVVDGWMRVEAARILSGPDKVFLLEVDLLAAGESEGEEIGYAHRRNVLGAIRAGASQRH